MDLTRIHGFTYCAVGVARRDATPPVGIYARSWAAARHDVAEGVHRPLTATALVMRPIHADASTLALIALDVGWFPYLPDERRVRESVLRATGLDEDALLINFSHTHAGAHLNTQIRDKPGVHLIEPYLNDLTHALIEAIIEARSAMRPAWITYGYGRCALAANRDFWAPDIGRYACGYNPAAPADDTVLVARVTGEDGAIIATLVNYACHPTTLAWQNRLLSPDYVGALRETLESIYGAPCLFLYGAAGDLGPRDGFVGDPAIADRNGRQLAYAAAAALEALPPPASRFVYTGVVASGANLATWEYQPLDAFARRRCAILHYHRTIVPLPRKPTLEPIDPPGSDRSDAIAEAEKALRRRLLQDSLGDDPVYPMTLWFWRLGDALLVACPNEAYSQMQIEIRSRFCRQPVLVLGCTNGALGYLPPRHVYGSGLYQEQQSPFLPGCLEQTIAAAISELERL
ncbi:MAG: hypothetical protein NZ699_15895 [Roseiflexus sp.]|nr:hypothetical protein [Roseiflexus sp.]MDW8145483.1 hypothetical protein [Roseiflexaceae bacterium]